MVGVAACSLLAQPPVGLPPHGWSGGSRFAFMGFGPDMSQPVTGAPYSAVQTTQFTQKLPDGNVIQHSEQANVYRDSQGRVRIEHNFSGKAPVSGAPGRWNAISIFDPVAGYTYMLQPGSQKATKLPVRARPTAETGSLPMRAPHHGSVAANQPPPQVDNLGSQTINGVVSTGTRTTQTVPAGAIGNAQPLQIVREVWVAQDLKVPVMMKTSDPRFGDTVMQLTNVVQANPDPSLFQVPAGYTIEASPPSGHMWRGEGSDR